MSDTPFADRIARLPHVRVEPEQDSGEGPHVPHRRFPGLPGGKAPMPPARVRSGEVADFFQTAIGAVQTRFTHLSAEDIAYPPHGLFDAHLGRQIALHLMVMRIGVPKRRIVEDLERSREAINRALSIIEERMAKNEFAQAYEAIAADAMENIKSKRLQK